MNKRASLILGRFDRDKSRVADRVLEKERNKQIGRVFDAKFSSSEMIDAVADVYLGVSAYHPRLAVCSNICLVHILECPYWPRSGRLVLSPLAHGHLWL